MRILPPAGKTAMPCAAPPGSALHGAPRPCSRLACIPLACIPMPGPVAAGGRKDRHRRAGRRS